MLHEGFFRFRRVLVLGIHLLLIPLGYLAAFALRFDFDIPPQYLTLYVETVPILLATRFLAFGLFGLLRGWWRHASIRDMLDLAQAITLSSGLLIGALFLTQQLQGLPRSVLMLDWILAVLLFGGARLGVRGVREGRLLSWNRSRARKALIVGAGTGGEGLIRQLLRHDGVPEFEPIGLVDDDPAKQRMRLHGVPVIGKVDDIPELVVKHAVRLIVIAIPSADREQMQSIVDRCLEAEVDFKIVPSLRELVDGRARLNQLRRVDIQDLLGREAIQLDLKGVEDDIRGKVVLITGGAGSIGSELARQVAAFGPRRLVLVDQAESPLYFIHLELLQNRPGIEIVPIVADITDELGMDRIFAAQRPAYVFHAAAYKHVPMMEANVAEAVRNNVFGTLRVAQCSARHGANKFVLISTDKAVNPSSVMGATKRIAERIVLGWGPLRESATDFRTVRFGNVLGSDGSVIPLFRRQLEQGGPLTVTHPDVTRYFMTIPEAVHLVLQAAALPEAARRVAMLEMGEPVRIVELAENLIRLSGLEPHRDVTIRYTGLRPGEKLHEELTSSLEATVATSLEKIRVVQTESEGAGPTLESLLDHLATVVAVGDRKEIVAGVRAFVPECVPPLRETLHRQSLSAEQPSVRSTQSR